MMSKVTYMIHGFRSCGRRLDHARSDRRWTRLGSQHFREMARYWKCYYNPIRITTLTNPMTKVGQRLI
jgi:hypothetical protein